MQLHAVPGHSIMHPAMPPHAHVQAVVCNRLSQAIEAGACLAQTAGRSSLWLWRAASQLVPQARWRPQLCAISAAGLAAQISASHVCLNALRRSLL